MLAMACGKTPGDALQRRLGVLRESLVLDEQERRTAIVGAAVVGIGPADATGDHRQEMPVDAVEREHGRGKFRDLLLLAKRLHLKGGLHERRRKVAGFIRPRPEPGVWLLRFGAEQLDTPGVAVAEGEDAGRQVECQSSSPTNSLRWSCLSKEAAT